MKKTLMNLMLAGLTTITLSQAQSSFASDCLRLEGLYQCSGTEDGNAVDYLVEVKFSEDGSKAELGRAPIASDELVSIDDEVHVDEWGTKIRGSCDRWGGGAIPFPVKRALTVRVDANYAGISVVSQRTLVQPLFGSEYRLYSKMRSSNGGSQKVSLKCIKK